MARLEATPNPALLTWARQTAGMSVDVAARKAQLKPEKLSAWEEGTARPTIPQLRKLASIYHRPLAALYLSDVPPRFQVMHDFRRLSPGINPPEKSPKLAYEIRRAYDRREWALELMTEVDELPKPFKATANSHDGVEHTAQQLRNAIGVSVSRQRLWRSDNEAFRQWRMLFEHAGILTLQATTIELNDARGFSISLKPLPVAVTNIKDAPRGRIFTLLHEATHVMLNEGGICDLHDSDIEAFCNRVAGAALFPKESLLDTTVVRKHKKGDPRWTDAELRELSREFGGSREAALVRLLTLGLTTQQYYDHIRRILLEEYERQQRERAESSTFPPPHVVAIASAGPLFTSLVLENFNRENLTASDASDYLGVRPKHIRELRIESGAGGES